MRAYSSRDSHRGDYRRDSYSRHEPYPRNHRREKHKDKDYRRDEKDYQDRDYEERRNSKEYRRDRGRRYYDD